MGSTRQAIPYFRRWYALGALAALLILAGLFLIQQSRLREPKVAVETYFDCVDRRDAGCLASLTGEYERADSPTRAQMQEFVRTIFAPRLDGFKPVGEIEYETGLYPEAEAFGTRKYRHPDGREIYLVSSGRATEGKAVTWPNFASLVLAVCQTYAQKGEVPGSSVVLQRGLTDLKPQMERLGIRGAFLNTDQGERFYTWDEWIGRTAPKP